MFTRSRQRSCDDTSLILFMLPGFPDPGWKVFYDSATPNSERMPDPWDAVSGLDRLVWTNHFPPCEIQTVLQVIQYLFKVYNFGNHCYSQSVLTLFQWSVCLNAASKHVLFVYQVGDPALP